MTPGFFERTEMQPAGWPYRNSDKRNGVANILTSVRERRLVSRRASKHELMEIVMFNRRCGYAKRPGDAMRNENPMRSAVIAGCIILLAATTLPSSADATTIQQCKQKSAACDAKCAKRSIGKDICYRKCDIAYLDCFDNASNTPDKKVDPGPDPLRPKGTGGHTPPTGGAKDEPKAPPKVNDTRAPIGGGVFHSTTSRSGTGGPTQKSSGGNGSTFRSNNERR